jgi:hypothetical protein
MKPLDTLLRRGDQPLVVEPCADVAVVRRHVAARVQPPAGFDDVGAICSSVRYSCRRLSAGSSLRSRVPGTAPGTPRSRSSASYPVVRRQRLPCGPPRCRTPGPRTSFMAASCPRRSGSAAQSGDDSVDHAPEGPGGEQSRIPSRTISNHGSAGESPASPECAAATPSSSRRAVSPSGLSGASSTTRFHSARWRHAGPPGRTRARCPCSAWPSYGRDPSASERSNCASARSVRDSCRSSSQPGRCSHRHRSGQSTSARSYHSIASSQRSASK